MKLNKYLAGAVSIAMGVSFVGCNDDDNYFINTDGILTEVTTGSAQTTATTAEITGTVKDLSSQAPSSYTVGVIYGTDEASLLTSGRSVAGTLGEDGYTVSTSVSGLNDGQTYYYATFVTLQKKFTEYGEIKAFVTTDSQLGTAEAASVTATTANLGATLNGVDDLLAQGMEHGIIIASDPSGISYGARFADNGNEGGYTVKATGLVPNTTYHYAAYMVMNRQFIVDPAIKSFTTGSLYDPANDESELYVDMGLSKDWATVNIGAESPSEVGGLYGYGDISGVNRSTDLEAYASKSISSTEYDIAKAAGAGFIPTAADWNELIANSDLSEESVDGVDMIRVTSRITGNSILLPYVSSRTGDVLNHSFGGYMAGEIAQDNADFNKMYALTEGRIVASQAYRYVGQAVRPVRNVPYRAPKIDNDKIVFGDLENNGRIRIEIYNEFGGTASNPPVNTSLVNFSNNMQVVFRISGLTGDAATGFYNAGLSYAAASWEPSTWGDAKTTVHGDGVYTISWNAPAHCEGAVVWCIDIDGLGTAIGEDLSGLKCEILSISLDNGAVEFVGKNLAQDEPMTFSTIDNTKIASGDLENNGNYRIELYNEFGKTKETMPLDLSLVNFSKKLDVTFSVSGINGSATGKEYQAKLSYAAASWDPSTWGEKSVTVKGDGTYTVSWDAPAQCDGAVVWCVDIEGMSKDLDNVDGVIANIVSVVLDNGNVVFRGDGVSKQPFDNSRLSTGDLENNGNYRIEIYNDFGSTKDAPPVDLSLINFSEKLKITFEVTGITGTAAAKTYNAALSYAAASWDPSTWGEKSVAVTGDGTYTVEWDAPGLCEGAVVWCIDIQGLAADLGDVSAVTARIKSIDLDNGKVVFAGK